MPWDGAFPIMPSRCSAVYNREPAAFFLIHPLSPSLRAVCSSLPEPVLSFFVSPSLCARDGLFPAAFRRQCRTRERRCVCARVRENKRVRSRVHVCVCVCVRARLCSARWERTGMRVLETAFSKHKAGSGKISPG